MRKIFIILSLIIFTSSIKVVNAEEVCRKSNNYDKTLNSIMEKVEKLSYKRKIELVEEIYLDFKYSYEPLPCAKRYLMDGIMKKILLNEYEGFFHGYFNVLYMNKDIILIKENVPKGEYTYSHMGNEIIKIDIQKKKIIERYLVGKNSVDYKEIFTLNFKTNKNNYKEYELEGGIHSDYNGVYFSSGKGISGEIINPEIISVKPRGVKNAKVKLFSYNGKKYIEIINIEYYY